MRFSRISSILLALGEDGLIDDFLTYEVEFDTKFGVSILEPSFQISD